MNKLKSLVGTNNLVGDVLDEVGITGFETRLLNLRLLLLYGTKEVFHPFLNMPYEDVVSLLAQDYGELWQRLIIDYAELDGLMNYRRVTETITSSKDNNAERSNIDSTVAYNSPELITEGGASETSAGNEQGEVVRDLKEYDVKIADLISNLSLLRKNAIIEIINNDISRFLTLSVY